MALLPFEVRKPISLLSRVPQFRSSGHPHASLPLLAVERWLEKPGGPRLG